MEVIGAKEAQTGFQDMEFISFIVATLINTDLFHNGEPSALISTIITMLSFPSR